MRSGMARVYFKEDTSPILEIVLLLMFAYSTFSKASLFIEDHANTRLFIVLCEGK